MYLAQKSRRYYVPGEKNPSNTLTIPITRVGGNERNHAKRGGIDERGRGSRLDNFHG